MKEGSAGIFAERRGGVIKVDFWEEFFGQDKQVPEGKQCLSLLWTR